MNIYDYLDDQGYRQLGNFSYEGQIISVLYIKNDTLVVIDKLAICDNKFEYKRYCQKQNEWTKKYKKVYRFLEDDIEMLQLFFESNDNNFYDYRTVNRADANLDPTPLEWIFEECFAEAYNAEAYKYLGREQSIILKNGKIGYFDYALYCIDKKWFAIEENGVSYHHPYIIKLEKYRKMLMKQNSVVDQNGTVYRWDTESLQNREKIIDEIKEFFGDINQYKDQIYYQKPRTFKFYDHQVDYLKELVSSRKDKMKTSLVVLPVGSGKTTIAIEDIIEFRLLNKSARVLIMVPSIDLVTQWTKELEMKINDTNGICVKTYSKVSREYKYQDNELYDYIVIDEAHHSVAPVMQKVIRHFNPKFLLGLTATDKRLDEKKLEDVFGSYDTKLSIKEAIKQNILCPIRGYRLETNIDLSEVRFNGKDYMFSQLEKQIKIPSRNELIADIVYKYFYKKLPKQGIVFCVSVNHAKEMAKILKERGISAESVDGKDSQRDSKVKNYLEGKLKFLCTCSLLTEGFDAPNTSVIIMARPTLSRVLYMQQLGRGTRKAPGKEALYVIDVVDQYGSYGSVSNRPWSLNALFSSTLYSDFGNIVDGDFSNDELAILDTIHEEVVKLEPFEIFTLEKKYDDYLSSEQLARELFVSTGTIKSWARKKQIPIDVILPIGRGKLYLYKPERVQEIRLSKGLKVHSEETIVSDFWEFIDTYNYTFSYKMYFTLAMIELVDHTGDANIKDVVNKYKQSYLDRHRNKKSIDKSNSPYNDLNYLNDMKLLQKSMLMNPFEKFERKRFMYYNKELSKISYHHLIWEELYENNGLKRLKEKMYGDLDRYYAEL